MPHYTANRNLAVTSKLAYVLERYHEQGSGIALLPPVVQGSHAIALFYKQLVRQAPLRYRLEADGPATPETAG